MKCGIYKGPQANIKSIKPIFRHSRSMLISKQKLAYLYIVAMSISYELPHIICLQSQKRKLAEHDFEPISLASVVNLYLPLCGFGGLTDNVRNDLHVDDNSEALQLTLDYRT